MDAFYLEEPVIENNSFGMRTILCIFKYFYFFRSFSSVGCIFAPKAMHKP